MLGTSAVTVKTNEHNLTDTLEWPKASLSKQGKIRFSSIDVKRKYINTKRINNTIIQRNRRNDEISRENLKIGKAINRLENRKLSHYGGLEHLGSGAKLSHNNSIQFQDQSASELDVLRDQYLTQKQKNDLIAQLSMKSVNQKSKQSGVISIHDGTAEAAPSTSFAVHKINTSSNPNIDESTHATQMQEFQAVKQFTTQDLPASSKISQISINEASTIAGPDNVNLVNRIQKLSGKRNQNMSVTQTNGQGFSPTKNHALTPMNNPKVNLGETEQGPGGNYNTNQFLKTQQQFPNIHHQSNQFNKTSNSFITTQQQSNNIIDNHHQYATESMISGVTSSHRNTFENRSHSLNMPARTLEDQRVLRENYKLMRRICNAQPQRDLSRRKLSFDFDNACKIKKLIAQKYLKRDEMQIYKALIKNVEVRNNLPQLSPINEPHKTISQKSQNFQFALSDQDKKLMGSANSRNALGNIASDQSIQKQQSMNGMSERKRNSINEVHNLTSALSVFSNKQGNTLKRFQSPSIRAGGYFSLVKSIPNTNPQNEEQQLADIMSQFGYKPSEKKSVLAKNLIPKLMMLHNESEFLHSESFLDTQRRAFYTNIKESELTPTKRDKPLTLQPSPLGQADNAYFTQPKAYMVDQEKTKWNIRKPEDGLSILTTQDVGKQSQFDGPVKYLNNNPNQNVDQIEEVDENEYSKLEYAKALINTKKNPKPVAAKKEQVLIHAPKIGSKLRHKPTSQQNSSSIKESSRSVTKSKDTTSKSKEEILDKKAASPVKIIANKTPKTPIKPPALTPKKSISSVKSIGRVEKLSPSPNKTSLVAHMPQKSISPNESKAISSQGLLKTPSNVLQQAANLEIQTPKVDVISKVSLHQKSQKSDTINAGLKSNADKGRSHTTLKQKEIKSQKSKIQKELEDSNQESDDDFFPKEQNAKEYFEELEENKSLEVPSNADGGSVFNQTGGRFLGRQGTITHTSIYKNSSQAEGVDKMAKTGDVEKPVKTNAALKQTGSSRYELYNESKEQTVKVEALHTAFVTEQDQEQNPSVGKDNAAQEMSAFQKKIIDEPSDDEYSDDSDHNSAKHQSPERKPFDVGASEEDEDKDEDDDMNDSDEKEEEESTPDKEESKEEDKDEDEEDEEYSEDNNSPAAEKQDEKEHEKAESNHNEEAQNIKTPQQKAAEHEEESEQDYSNDDDFDETDPKTTSQNNKTASKLEEVKPGSTPKTPPHETIVTKKEASSKKDTSSKYSDEFD